jgi:hypothetical protein
MSYDQLTPWSANINGNLESTINPAAVNPTNFYAPSYQGQGVSPPTLPPIDNDGGAKGQVVQEARSKPFDLQKSPVLWMVGLLIISVLGLRYVHWGQ